MDGGNFIMEPLNTTFRSRSTFFYQFLSQLDAGSRNENGNSRGARRVDETSCDQQDAINMPSPILDGDPPLSEIHSAGGFVFSLPAPLEALRARNPALFERPDFWKSRLSDIEKFASLPGTFVSRSLGRSAGGREIYAFTPGPVERPASTATISSAMASCGIFGGQKGSEVGRIGEYDQVFCEQLRKNGRPISANFQDPASALRAERRTRQQSAVACRRKASRHSM
jgi:hypothetical protein